jgi:hypothetical protein
VGGYRLLRPLGSGGMGTVYEAEDTASGRRVALKLISPDYAGSTDVVERFRREGRLASTLSHPRCVFVLAADEEAGRPYIVMELMPGRTLEDLVAAEGPMKPETAIARIFDVIDGLQEAHRLGFIHRDVKPSNCFLDAEDRVKVGDFGLAKSLTRGENLTRTGSFLGTLLFAAPEQIKGEPVDAQTDVYAVAATLYYLLTGRAPFAGGDAAATLARTVSEPAPSMRGPRPELDAALDAVVLRGLERDRGRRWRGLAEFRAALLPFQPGALSIATLGVRFAAYLLDCFFLFLVNALLTALLMPAAVTEMTETPSSRAPQYLALAVSVLYYALLEGLWGASLGKRLLRLRVRRASGRARPGLVRALLRTAAFEGLLNLALLTQIAVWLLFAPAGSSAAEWARDAPCAYLLLSLIPLAGMVAGIAALLAPMRARNGYRGLHEWISGTRVVCLPWPEKRRALAGRPLDWALLQPHGVPESLGPFVIHGALRWDDRARVLLGQDRGLGRAVWLWLRPRTDEPLSNSRREISRVARLRWLACGRDADWQWDAFMAFGGGPLDHSVRPGGESWPLVRPILEQLADELAVAAAEGTLPDTLDRDQVWIGSDGQVQLLDVPLGERDAHAGQDGRARSGLPLLAQVAALSLEGRPRLSKDRGPIRAPVALPARRMLDRLLGIEKPYRNIGDFQADLKAADQPAEVGRFRRAGHLAVLAGLLVVGMGCCMVPAGWYAHTTPGALLLASVREKEHRLRELEQLELIDFGSRAVNPDPWVRLHGAVQLDADYRLRDRLRQSLEKDRLRYSARRESSSWFNRQVFDLWEKQMAAQSDEVAKEQRRRFPQLYGVDKFRLQAEVAITSLDFSQVERGMAVFWFIPLVAWPALWVVWAFLARGGLSYRMTGLALVRRDGRPAARWQCAWRALLVWTPVTGLLVLSFGLEERYWSAWEMGGAPRWLLDLASASWYAALLLLVAFVLMALWRPARTLHDRLAGTYLVPR